MYTQNELSEWSKCVHEYTDEEVNTWVRSQIDEMEEFAKGHRNLGSGIFTTKIEDHKNTNHRRTFIGCST